MKRMRLARFARPLATLALSAGTFIACGGSPTVSSDDVVDSELDAGSLENPDATAAGDDSQGGNGSATDDSLLVDGEDECQPKSCAELNAECGQIADDCGGLADCGGCGDGEECGIVEHNVCTSLAELCEPQPKADVCDGKECGTEGDGCGGTYDCGTCPEGEVCGAQEAFQCDVGVGNDCTGRVASCADVGAECGQIGDGCGGVLDCDAEAGGCPDGEVCGVEGEGLCGVPPSCEPLDAADACNGKCGVVSNGCGAEVDGGLIQCPGCPDGEACGAGGVVNVCGSAENACVELTVAEACDGRSCGVVSDGCASSHTCGSCTDGGVCLNGYCSNECEPMDQATACDGLQCGVVSDGCGGTHDCGTCSGGQVCGVLAAFQCDTPPPSECVPRSVEQACLDKQCGTVFDGCGSADSNRLDCGSCPQGELCGALTAFQCDAPPGQECTPAESCAALGWECGLAIDDCGNVLDCSAEGLSCDAVTETCMGGIEGPATCVGGAGVETLSDCDVCDSIPDCSAAAQATQLTGRVVTPGRNDTDSANQIGVPNAYVYILQTSDETTLPAMSAGIPAGGTSCERCADQDLGLVLAGDTTDSNGEFMLQGNIPVGEEFVLVVKIGKFRRAVKYTVAAEGACATTALPLTSTRLPRSMSDGLGVNLPHIAIATGKVDAMECVFEKMGISTDEFELPGDAAVNPERVHMYRANGAAMPAGTTSDAALYGSLERLMSYDMVVFSCEGSGYGDHNTADPDVREYVNRGGRLFASHLSYTWLDDNGYQVYWELDPFNTGLGDAAVWTSSGYPDTGTGIVSVGRGGANASKIQSFADWLVNEGAASFDGSDYTFDVVEPRDLASSVGEFSEEFVYRQLDASKTSVQQFAFNTPYGAPEEDICGRVAYTGFHVTASAGDDFANDVFPDHCSGDLTAQEKVLLYMLFDLGSCVSTGIPEPPSCTPVSDCTGRCGNLPDGCGGVTSCECSGGNVCLSGGVCGLPPCVATTCAGEGATCGFIADGCGGLLDCGDCQAGQECGLVAANQCTNTCTPSDAATACAGKCGFVSDGCGDVHECPSCDGGLTCRNNQCTTDECIPSECPVTAECGIISDGCSASLNCGECTLPDVCGGAGVANECGHPECPALSCADLDADCGWIGDGCGAAVDCGSCAQGQVCTAVAGKNRCVGCAPLTCTDAGAECGAIGDGCGGIVQCGSCPQGESCGAGGPNVCGPTTQCTPRTCGQAGAECGLVGDGCGGTVECGLCPAGEICGISQAFKCDAPPACAPSTCESAGAECGAISDGCGGLVDCGACPVGKACGLSTPNQCDSVGTAK